MLTADLVRAYKKNGELVVRQLKPADRLRAVELAEAYLEVARGSVGASRDELVEAWAGVPIVAREKRLADGIKKLVDDACEFSAVAPVDPVALRADVFLQASAARRDATSEVRFDRTRVLEPFAESHGLTSVALERALYADLKGEQILLAPSPACSEHLIEDYERGQAQAVLLRAVRVVADVSCASPDAYRALFRELKFRRLLFRIEPREPSGYRIEIDGPYSMFESVTKYGLELALILPALEACDELSLRADVRWGKARESLVFRHETSRDDRRARRAGGTDASRVRDDIAALVEAFDALDTPWRASESTHLFDMPGLGICVPDLVFEHRFTRERVYFEALGYWSRDAAWQRVELAKAGLPQPILFAVSSRLRVSEAILDDVETAALYVYKGVMNPRAIERKLDELATGAGK
jgi:predicted nuclease of restriction endonuclease-like RecB superfamily